MTVGSASAAQSVSFRRVDSAAVVAIDRPERRNAVDGQTADALRAAFAQFEADDEARVLVLTGAGGHAFSAGADLTALESLGPRVYDPDGCEGFTRLSATKPTIAAIDGWCVAGGLELALWCDLRICTASSRFGFFERRFGVPLLDGGTQRLPRVIGMGRALELILTGRPVDADEALRIGLVTEVVGPGAHLTRALELAETLAAFPQDAMLADRRAAIDGIGRTFEDGLALEARLGGATVQTAVQGAARFRRGEGRSGEGTGVQS